MSDNSSIVKNSILFTLAPFLPKVIGVFMMPIMTKYLTDVDFGISGTIAAYSQSIGAFATLGLGIVLMNSFFKTPVEYKTVWRQIYGFLKLWMIFYAVVQAVLLYFIIPEEALENRWWIIILTNFSTVFFGPTATIGSSYYQYTKQAFPVVWRSVLASVLTIFVNFFLIVYLKWGYMGWYVGGFAGTFFSNASYWYVVNKKLGFRPEYHFKWSEIKHSLSVSIPTIPHYYTQYLLSGSGRMVMDRYHISQGEIGRVSLVQQIGDMYTIGVNGINQALSPYLMQSIKEDREDNYRKLGIAFTAVSFSAAFVMAIWSKEIMDILISNESLKTAYPLFIAYVMALCYRPLYIVSCTYNFYYEKTKQLLLISFLSGIVALVLYIALTPFLGVWGFLVGHYIASLYHGYAGFFFSCYRQYAKMKFPYVISGIVQLILTFLAFVLVEMLWAKIIVTLAISVLMGIIVIKNKSYFIRKA